MQLSPAPRRVLARPRRTVAVIGGGASGTLAALSLARVATETGVRLRILVVERDAHGPGLAYSTCDDLHRLNVPTARMSARPGHAHDFSDWSQARCRCGACGSPGEFAPRRRYGQYLKDTLGAACGQAAGDVEIVPVVAQATALRGGRLELTDGRAVACHAAVLALGNFPPAPVPHLPRGPRVICDPWRTGALESIARPGRILLVGTGLTMIDVALTLAERFPEAQIEAVSRSGLTPRSHLAEPERPAAPAVTPDEPLALDDLVREVSFAIAAAGPAWRTVVDGLRPVSQAIWRALPVEDRRRFLRSRLAREWEVRRHRMAPSVAARVGELQADGRLATGRGEVTSARPGRDGLAVRVRDGRAERTIGASHVVNCTGPSHDVRRVANPLVRDLLESGRARPHPLGPGFQVDERGALVGTAGEADASVLAIGALRRGALYETTAIPEIREQAMAAAGVLVGSLVA